MRTFRTMLMAQMILIMKKYDISTPVALKKGVYNLNGEANFNYQLNRVINWDGLESETGR